jgi:lysyl-tRNA synthetase, class II
VFRVERHELGPRLWVLGRRLHECHAGAALAVLVLAGAALGVPLAWLAVPALLGAWMLVKDWQDFIPARRDTAAWSAGIHRRPAPLRAVRRANWLAPLIGVLASAMGAVNVASTLTPDFSDRHRVLRHLLPDEWRLVAHALALPAGLALVLTGVYLALRRRRAWALAVGLLAAAGVLNVLKGLDLEEALAGWGLVAVLVWGRGAFCVVHDGPAWRTAVPRVGAVLAAAFGTAMLTLLVTRHWAAPALPLARIPGEAAALLTLGGSSFTWRDPFDWVPAGVAILGIGALVAAAWTLFRPLRPSLAPPLPGARRLARDIVERHGRDTLSFFKLREDKQYFFDSTGRAFAGYRVEGSVLLVSGDPVGPADAVPGLLREICAFAEVRGLRVGVVGASEAFAELGRGAGLKSFYIGDEAIVDLPGFSLEGRPIRKVRQSVTRLDKAGFSASLHRLGALAGPERAELEEVSDRWRDGEPERGFSMAMDTLRGEHLEDSLVLVCRDEADAVRGFLHFVPCFGRPAMSLSFMRRERDTPNGLTEFMVVRAVELLRAEGIEEVSLNFAAFARLLHSPDGRLDRALGRLVALANPYFQIESLYRFNAKFFPRWQPRYLLYEGALGLPRTGVAALSAEGQLPTPRLLLSSSS